MELNPSAASFKPGMGYAPSSVLPFPPSAVAGGGGTPVEESGTIDWNLDPRFLTPPSVSPGPESTYVTSGGYNQQLPYSYSTPVRSVADQDTTNLIGSMSVFIPGRGMTRVDGTLSSPTFGKPPIPIGFKNSKELLAGISADEVKKETSDVRTSSTSAVCVDDVDDRIFDGIDDISSSDDLTKTKYPVMPSFRLKDNNSGYFLSRKISEEDMKSSTVVDALKEMAAKALISSSHPAEDIFCRTCRTDAENASSEKGSGKIFRQVPCRTAESLQQQTFLGQQPYGGPQLLPLKPPTAGAVKSHTVAQYSRITEIFSLCLTIMAKENITLKRQAELADLQDAVVAVTAPVAANSARMVVARCAAAEGTAAAPVLTVVFDEKEMLVAGPLGRRERSATAAVCPGVIPTSDGSCPPTAPPGVAGSADAALSAALRTTHGAKTALQGTSSGAPSSAQRGDEVLTTAVKTVSPSAVDAPEALIVSSFPAQPAAVFPDSQLPLSVPTSLPPGRIRDSAVSTAIHNDVDKASGVSGSVGYVSISTGATLSSNVPQETLLGERKTPFEDIAAEGNFLKMWSLDFSNPISLNVTLDDIRDPENFKQNALLRVGATFHRNLFSLPLPSSNHLPWTSHESSDRFNMKIVKHCDCFYFHRYSRHSVELLCSRIFVGHIPTSESTTPSQVAFSIFILFSAHCGTPNAVTHIVIFTCNRPNGTVERTACVWVLPRYENWVLLLDDTLYISGGCPYSIVVEPTKSMKKFDGTQHCPTKKEIIDKDRSLAEEHFRLNQGSTNKD